MMDEVRLAQITEHLTLWTQGDPVAFTADDAEALVRELTYMRAQHEHIKHLYHRARDELLRVNDQYTELLRRAEAWAAHEEAESYLAARARYVQDQAEEGQQ